MSIRKNDRGCFPVLFLALLSWSAALNAQTFTGSIQGTVTDPSNAVIQNADITLTNAGTNETRTAKSNDLGHFSFPLLPPAVYRIEAQAPGFKRFVQENIKLNVTMTALIPVALA